MNEVVKIVYWYDRRSRNWVVQCLDAEGNQVGDADYCGTRKSRDYALVMYSRQWTCPYEKLKR